MKTLALTLAALCLLLTRAPAQTVKGPADFVGIPWGASEQVVREKIQAREGVKFRTEVAAKGKTVWEGGTLAGQQVETWHFWVKDGKFAQSQVTVSYDAETAYTALKTQLIAQYGRPKTEKAGRGEKETIWKFPVSSVSREPTTIRLVLGPEGSRKEVLRLF